MSMYNNVDMIDSGYVVNNGTVNASSPSTVQNTTNRVRFESDSAFLQYSSFSVLEVTMDATNSSIVTTPTSILKSQHSSEIEKYKTAEAAFDAFEDYFDPDFTDATDERLILAECRGHVKDQSRLEPAGRVRFWLAEVTSGFHASAHRNSHSPETCIRTATIAFNDYPDSSLDSRSSFTFDNLCPEAIGQRLCIAESDHHDLDKKRLAEHKLPDVTERINAWNNVIHQMKVAKQACVHEIARRSKWSHGRFLGSMVPGACGHEGCIEEPRDLTWTQMQHWSDALVDKYTYQREVTLMKETLRARKIKGKEEEKQRDGIRSVRSNFNRLNLATTRRQRKLKVRCQGSQPGNPDADGDVEMYEPAERNFLTE